MRLPFAHGELKRIADDAEAIRVEIACCGSGHCKDSNVSSGRIEELAALVRDMALKLMIEP